MCCKGSWERVETVMTTLFQRDLDTEELYAPLGAILEAEWHG